MKKSWKLASFLSVLAIAAGGVAIAAPANAATSNSAGLCPSLGTTISWGNNPNGSTTAAVSAPGTILWTQASLCLTNGPYTATFQNDGNFVVYKNRTPLWQTQTDINFFAPHSNRIMSAQSDGNIVVYASASPFPVPLWNSFGVSFHRPQSSYQLQMQSDGNLVEYGYPTPNSNVGRVVIWAAGTNGK